MRFDPEYRPFVAPRCIYILPLAADPYRYRVLIPDKLSRRLLDLLIQDRLRIGTFRACPPEAAAGVLAQLDRMCDRCPSRLAERSNQLVTAGTALLLLGIINAAIPDPLPLADELLMIAGGAGIGAAGLLARRRNLPLLRAKTLQAQEGLERLAPVEQLLLTRIHEAIEARSASGNQDANNAGLDSFEAESRWLVECLDLHQLLESERITVELLTNLIEALSGAFPLSRFLALELKARRDPTNVKARRRRERAAERFELSADALTVYAEFYRLALQITSERHE